MLQYLVMNFSDELTTVLYRNYQYSWYVVKLCSVV